MNFAKFNKELFILALVNCAELEYNNLRLLIQVCG